MKNFEIILLFLMIFSCQKEKNEDKVIAKSKPESSITIKVSGDGNEINVVQKDTVIIENKTETPQSKE